MCQDANPHVGDRIQPYRSDGESLVSHNFTRNRGKDREIGNCANGFLEEATGDFGLESKAGKKKKKTKRAEREFWAEELQRSGGQKGNTCEVPRRFSLMGPQ